MLLVDVGHGKRPTTLTVFNKPSSRCKSVYEHHIADLENALSGEFAIPS
jgi:uncharacterized protein (DUF1786 family)